MHDHAINPKSSLGITLVIGGTGNTGRRVAERRRALGRRIRIGSRAGNPAFDRNDRSTWSASLTDVSAVYITFAPDLAVSGSAETIQAVMELAVESGVQRLVRLSGRGEVEAQACERIV